MGRIFIEGFEGQDGAAWQAISYPANWSVVSGDPDFHGYYLEHAQSSYGLYHQVLPSGYNELYVAMKMKILSSLGVDNSIFQFWNTNVSLCYFGIDWSTWRWVVGSASSDKQYSDELATTDLLYKVQFYCKIDATVGRLVLKIDDVTVCDFTGDTRHGSPYTAVNTMTAFNIGSYAKMRFDDIIIETSEYPGDTEVMGIKPIAEGATTSWTPSGEADNWDNVDECPYSDTDFNWTNDVDQLDTFETENLSGAIKEVKAVQVSARIIKSGLAVPQNINMAVRIGGVDYLSPDLVIPSLKGPVYYCWDLSPATSADWSESEVNAAEFGYKSKA